MHNNATLCQHQWYILIFHDIWWHSHAHPGSALDSLQVANCYKYTIHQHTQKHHSDYWLLWSSPRVVNTWRWTYPVETDLIWIWFILSSLYHNQIHASAVWLLALGTFFAEGRPTHSAMGWTNTTKAHIDPLSGWAWAQTPCHSKTWHRRPQDGKKPLIFP